MPYTPSTTIILKLAATSRTCPYLAVLRRVVPTLGLLDALELNQDQALGEPVAFQRFNRRTASDEAAQLNRSLITDSPISG
jgi:hypothetical protein